MSADAMPKGITRGYAKSFLEMLGSLPAKVLTIPDLNALDDADLASEIARAEVPQTVELADGTP